MKKTLTLGTMVLSCCLVAFAQYSNQAPSGSSTSGYPLDRAGQSQSYPSSSADQSYFGSSADQPYSAVQKTTVQGCLTQSADGAFVLADTSGNTYQLNDSSARLGQFLGQEIRVDGFGIVNSESSPGSMASSADQRGSAQQIDVSRVRKVAGSCKSSSSQ